MKEKSAVKSCLVLEFNGVTMLLVIAKLLGLNISWWIVFSPTILYFAIGLVTFIILLITFRKERNVSQ